MITPKDLPRYICHKVVQACKIARIEAQVSPVILYPEDASLSPIEVSQQWCSEKHVDQRSGYYVVYEDGYTSWSPVEAFEKGYTPFNDKDAELMTHCDAFLTSWIEKRDMPHDFDDVTYVMRAFTKHIYPLMMRKERENTDAFINAIGEASVAEIQEAIYNWRRTHEK